MQFVHLGIYTEFSITESIVRIPDLVKTAVKDEMPALALTDLSNLHAAVKFYNSCLRKALSLFWVVQFVLMMPNIVQLCLQ